MKKRVHKTRIILTVATFIMAFFVLGSSFFVFKIPEALSFGHPDVVAPMVTIFGSESKKQGENFDVNYTASDDYGSISSCALETSKDGGAKWEPRGTCTGSGGDVTIESAWCPDEGTSICGVRITVTDSAGNSRRHEKFFDIDGTPPIVELSSNRTNPTEKTDVTFTFWGSDEHTTPTFMANQGLECKLDGEAWEKCTSPKTYNGPLAEDSRTFRARAIDRAGNISPEKSITWEIDSKPPAKIIGATAGLVVSNPTYHSIDAAWKSPREDGATGAASEQYDIRYSFLPISSEDDWNNKTAIVKREISPAGRGSNETMSIGPYPTFDTSDENLLTSYLPHSFYIKSRDEKWNWSPISNIANITTKRDPCDYDADRVFSPKSRCGPNICDIDTQTCDLYDDPYDWGLQGDWSRDKAQDYSPQGQPWIQYFGSAIDDLDGDGEAVASSRTGLPYSSNISEGDFPFFEGKDWYDNPFTRDLASLKTPVSLKDLSNTINDLDLDTYVSESWKTAFETNKPGEPDNADIRIDNAGRNFAGCVYPEALEDECYDCTAYEPDPSTGRIPPTKESPSVVRTKAVCQIEAYYSDIAGKNQPWEIIDKGTLDPERPVITASANCRDGVDNNLNGTLDTGDDISTREPDCPQKFGVTWAPEPRKNAQMAGLRISSTGQAPNQSLRPVESDSTELRSGTGQAGIFPSAGLVQCGRYADDYTTPINEASPCGFCHFFYLFDTLIKLIIGRVMPFLVGAAAVLAGFLILTSAGNINRVTLGRKTIRWALTAYVISLISWVALSTFFSVFGIVEWTGFTPTRGSITELAPTSIRDTAETWEENRWKDMLVEIIPPKESEKPSIIYKIASNTQDTLNLVGSQPYSKPDSGPGYKYHIVGTGWWSFACDLGTGTLIADFEASPSSGNVPFAVNFTDLSVGDIKEWIWTFGDGTPSETESKSPTHTYSAPEDPNSWPIQTSLTVRGPGGQHTTTKTLRHAPEANFYVSVPKRHGRAPWTVNFQDESSGEIDERLWDFGDGETSAEQNPAHTYTEPGPYVVKLRVSGPGGYDTKTEVNYIFVYPVPPKPKAKFSYSIVPGTLTINFRNESLIEDGGESTPDDITSWLWEFKNNDTGAVETTAVKEPTHFFATNKTGYTVRLTAKGPGGEHTAKTTIIFPPRANFTATPQSGPLGSDGNLRVQFTDTSTGTVSKRKWDFNNDGKWDSSSRNPTRIYSANASYAVKLEVTNSLKETSTKIMTDYIVVAPGAYFTPSATEGEADLNVSFANNSRCLGSCTWLWNFGDGRTSTDKEPDRNTYANERYKTTLTVTDSSGRSHRSNPQTILSKPKPIFTIKPRGDCTGSVSCAGISCSGRIDCRGDTAESISFSESSRSKAHIESWLWEYDRHNDGDIDSTLTSGPASGLGDTILSLRVNNAGHYTIKLTVSGPPLDEEGNNTEVSVASVAAEDFIDFNPVLDSVNCSGPRDAEEESGTVSFRAVGGSPNPGAGGTTYTWSGCADGQTGSSASCGSKCGEKKTAGVTIQNRGGSVYKGCSYIWGCPTYGCKDNCADPDSQDFSADRTNNDLCTYNNAPVCPDDDVCAPPQPTDENLCPPPPPPPLTCTPGDCAKVCFSYRADCSEEFDFGCCL